MNARKVFGSFFFIMGVPILLVSFGLFLDFKDIFGATLLGLLGVMSLIAGAGLLFPDFGSASPNSNVLYQLVGQFEIKGAKYAVLIHSSRPGAEPYICRADNEVPPGTKYCRISEVPRKEEHNETRYCLEPVTMGELDSLVPPASVMWCPNCSSSQFPCSVCNS